MNTSEYPKENSIKRVAAKRQQKTIRLFETSTMSLFDKRIFIGYYIYISPFRGTTLQQNKLDC